MANSKTFLITGGAGFIGSHLVKEILAQGHRAVVFDNLSTGNIEQIPSNVDLIEGDITKFSAVKRVFKNIDGCFHLAAIASVEHSNRNWCRAHAVNSTGTVNVFQAACENKIPVCFASSAAVYGAQPKNKIVNEDDEVCPANAYGADKFSCELFGRVAYDVHRIPNIGLRYFNVYGPKFSEVKGVANIFAERIKRNAPIEIFGDGEQCRDFIHVDDAVSLTCRAMKLLLEQEISQSIFNISTKKATTIKQLATLIAAKLGNELKLIYSAKRAFDIEFSVGCFKKIESLVGPIKFRDLDEGLKAIIKQ